MAKTPDKFTLLQQLSTDELKQLLLDREAEEKEKAIREADNIRKQVVSKMNEVAKLIDPLVKQDQWSWRISSELEGIVAACELMPKEAKPVTIKDDLKELIVGFLQSKPNGATVEEIAAGLLDKEGKPRYAVGSLRPKMPVLVESKAIQSHPNPLNKRQNLYSAPTA